MMLSAQDPILARSRLDAGKLNAQALFHNTRDLGYRSPFGAVPAGTPVHLALRTAHQGATEVKLFTIQHDADGKTVGQTTTALHVGARSSKYDLWRASFTPTVVGLYQYYFRVKRGKVTAYYSSTNAQDGGPGQPDSHRPSVFFTMTVYDPGFATPSWMRDAVIYQIFPERFFNGDRSNDSTLMSPIYGGTIPTIHTNEKDSPLGGSDFFGGDLQGVIDKIPYLWGLGINTIWLNPIFLAPSNHKYDTSDYFTIDPHFGTMQTFHDLIATAKAHDIRIILDGVFNHTGSDSIYFNRYGDFHGLGAYQSKASPYFSWYHFNAWPSSYDTFFGFDSLPALQENASVKDFIYQKPTSVAQYWESQGSSGWRLDAAHLKSHQWWQDFRRSMKVAFPDNLMLCECDASPINASPWLLGNELDGTMNYRFREAILRFFANGRGLDNESGSRTSSMVNQLMSILEDYPLPALYSSMNLVDSHDTDRVLFDLLGNKAQLREVATLQMTWLGAPTVYYGDEAGLTGGKDPDDRRFFPWDNQDTALQDFYRTLISVRQGNAALRDGSVTPVISNDARRVFAYLRKDLHQTVAVIINDGGKQFTATIKLPGVPDGTHLADPLQGKSYTVSNGAVTAVVSAHSEAILTQPPAP